MMNFSGQGWQTILADLSIILFMVTANDLSNADFRDTPEEAGETAAMVATGEPVAIYRPGPDVISLGEWLSGQEADGRQQATILVRHAGAGIEQAIAGGLTLAAEAEAVGYPARLIVEQGDSPDLSVLLTYDSSAQIMARKLLSSTDTLSANPEPEETP